MVKGALVNTATQLPGGANEVNATAANWAGDGQLSSDQGLTPNTLIDPDSGSINYNAASWSAASWSTATDPLAASWSAASWSCESCSSGPVDGGDVGQRRRPDRGQLEHRRLDDVSGVSHERDHHHHQAPVSRMRSMLPHLAVAATRMSRGEVDDLDAQRRPRRGRGRPVELRRRRPRSPVVSLDAGSIWILLVAFAAAERFVVHVHFRRSAHSMSLGEIPLVFALVFAAGHDVILAGAHRAPARPRAPPPPARRSAWPSTSAQFLLGNCIAVIVFHAVAGAHDRRSTPLVWAAAALATVGHLGRRRAAHLRRGVAVRRPAQPPPDRRARCAPTSPSPPPTPASACAPRPSSTTTGAPRS